MCNVMQVFYVLCLISLAACNLVIHSYYCAHETLPKTKAKKDCSLLPFICSEKEHIGHLAVLNFAASSEPPVAFPSL